MLLQVHKCQNMVGRLILWTYCSPKILVIEMEEDACRSVHKCIQMLQGLGDIRVTLSMSFVDTNGCHHVSFRQGCTADLMTQQSSVDYDGGATKCPEVQK